TIDVELAEDHLRAVLDAVSIACREVPCCNATFAWSGIAEHDDVRVDLDLGPLSPPHGEGTITVIDYGNDGSDLAVPFVRVDQTAALRVGAVREGRAYVTLAVDHRAVDGVDAGRFLAIFAAALRSGEGAERAATRSTQAAPWR
ncbi:MAG: 2-oxo acid dehydrogenase subunit E2, partial [Candidatus Eremiobacteraeota bacterium]|nr:2-oxo acid dehydrogenase subunit E2 [Candidatus Eremiobacteraeota bacterium]